jgi:hypothetical protein
MLKADSTSQAPPPFEASPENSADNNISTNMNGYECGSEPGGIGVEAPSRAENFLQLIQQLLLLIEDIPTEEITLALPDSGDDQLKSWYNAMMDVLKRCDLMVSGPFMSLYSSHLSEDTSRTVSRTSTLKLQTYIHCRELTRSPIITIPGGNGSNGTGAGDLGVLLWFDVRL